MQLLKKFFSKIPSFSSSGKHDLAFLNITQSLGVINDNIFKFTMAFLLIDSLGKASASSILSATGAIYVIPFLLFSSSAGILADRFSKQKLLVLMKIAEIGIMILAIIAFTNKAVFGCYTLLFFLSIHSALFGPSKYGIIPELVSKDAVSKANGLITSFTYLSIILGTFFASFLTEITAKNFIFIACICLLISIGGLLSALAIKTTYPQGSKKEMNLFFVREIYRTLKEARSTNHLLPSIFGSSFFLMIGAFTQLNIIPFAMQALKMSDVAGGYLFLATAFGIALGAFLAGKASKKKVELGLSCMAGFGIAFFFFLLALFSSTLSVIIISLFIIGILGGIFIVPFDTFTQLSSTNEKRGQTIAAANFLSFTGVLIASALLFFLNEVCTFSPATSFAVVGIITLIVTALFTKVLSDLFFSYFSRKVLVPLTRFIPPEEKTVGQFSPSLFILEEANWKKALLLTTVIPHLKFVIPVDSRLKHPALRFFNSIQVIPESQGSPDLLKAALSHVKHAQSVCLVLDGKKLTIPANTDSNRFLSLFKKQSSSLVIAHFRTEEKTRKLRLVLEGVR